MTKNFKAAALSAVLILLLATGSGCAAVRNGETTEAETEAGTAGTVQLYHIDGDSIVADSGRYQLLQPDSLPASLEEVMSHVSLPAGITFERYSIDEEGNIRLEMTSRKNVPETDILLCKAEVVRNLKELKGAGDIGISFAEADGTVDAATYTDSSFFYYDDAADSAENTGNVTLYLPNGSSQLKKVTAYVKIDADDSAPESVLRQLIAYDVLPEGTDINQVSVMNGTATVDLSSAFLTGGIAVSPEVVIYSIVDSLTSLPNIRRVQLLADGKKADAFQGQVNIAGPLEFKSME